MAATDESCVAVAPAARGQGPRCVRQAARTIMLDVLEASTADGVVSALIEHHPGDPR
jgi:hypothetical protein